MWGFFSFVLRCVICVGGVDGSTATDIIDYTAADGTAVALTLVDEGAAAAGQADIAADGTVTFDAADTTIAQQIVAVEAAMTTATAVAGETAIWTNTGDATNSYIFISDGVAGKGAGDLLIHIIGDTAIALTLSDGNITAIARYVYEFNLSSPVVNLPMAVEFAAIDTILTV